MHSSFNIQAPGLRCALTLYAGRQAICCSTQARVASAPISECVDAQHALKDSARPAPELMLSSEPMRALMNEPATLVNSRMGTDCRSKYSLGNVARDHAASANNGAGSDTHAR